MNTTVPDRPLRSEAHVQLRSTTQSLENLLWWFPSLVPLFTILLSFYLQEWYWGLMDDVQLLQSGTNISERFVNNGTREGNHQSKFSRDCVEDRS